MAGSYRGACSALVETDNSFSKQLYLYSPISMYEKPSCSTSSPMFAVFFFFFLSHFCWMCSGITPWFQFEFPDDIRKNFPLLFFYLVFRPCSSHGLSQRLVFLVLGTAPACFICFCRNLPPQSSWRAVTHSVTSSAQMPRGPSEILGAFQCHDLETSQIWGVFWVQFISFSFSHLCWI